MKRKRRRIRDGGKVGGEGRDEDWRGGGGKGIWRISRRKNTTVTRTKGKKEEKEEGEEPVGGGSHGAADEGGAEGEAAGWKSRRRSESFWVNLPNRLTS